MTPRGPGAGCSGTIGLPVREAGSRIATTATSAGPLRP